MIVLPLAELERVLDALVRQAMREEAAALVAPRFLTTAEVAELLRVCEKTVGKLVRDEGLPEARSVGRERRFELEAVVAWMRGRPATVTALTRVK